MEGMKERKEENHGGNSEADLGEKKDVRGHYKGSIPLLTLVKLDRVAFKSMILSARSACHSGPLLSHSLHLGGKKVYGGHFRDDMYGAARIG